MKLNLPKNKWFYAFVITLAVVLVAAVVGVIVGVIASRPPEYVEGDEVGVYYYDVEGGEVVLTLSGGYNFTVTGPGINKTGTYKPDEENPGTFILDFFKEEDGTTTLTVNGDRLSLVYGNATMSLLKKTEYTVTFNTDGGSDIPAVKVMNGKTVARPADPTKENAVFLGWYADAALTTPYAFDTTVIKDDTTVVYAKWAYETVGTPAYTVSFDLGYEGATALEPVITVSGKAYGIVDPEREGYTFGGWWISAYADGSKLTEAYTEDTVFTADTTLYAVWYDNASTKLNAPAVNVSANMISWSNVKGATGYTLTVTAPNGTVLVDGENVGGTTKMYNFADLAAGEYTVSVVAVASNAENNSDPAVRYYANKTLDRVTDFRVVNGILVFGAVPNAEKYLITVDCGNDGHIHTAFDNGTSTVFYLTDCPMQEGGILITVTATADGYASSTSATFAYDLTLDKVGSVEYNKETDTFVWDAVPFAAKYIVTVTAGENVYVIDNGTYTTFSAAAYTGNIKISVVPATVGYNSPEGAEATCDKTAPAMPEGLSIIGNTLTWNASAGATLYEVKIGERTVLVGQTSLDLITAGFEMIQGQFSNVQVRAISASNAASAYSVPLKFGYFAMNSALSYEKNTVSWTPVLGINKFEVRVNGGISFYVEDATSTRVTLTKEGENLIEVRYVYGEEEQDWASVTVVAHTVEYDTRSPYSGSKYEYLAVGDVMSLPQTGFEYDGYNFGIWSNNPAGAAGNGFIYEEGHIFTGSAYTIVFATWTPKDYTIRFDLSGSNVSINNMQTGDTATVTYTKPFTLPVPTTSTPGVFFFAGWYSGKNGTGIQITDGNGECLDPYGYTRDLTLYPFFTSSVLNFVLETEGTYAGTYIVSAGPSISTATDLVIPAIYNELPVTAIKESGFSTANRLRTVKIPDTIKLVGVNAFRNASKLESIEVYKAAEGTYETFYSSELGALLRNDMGVIYLEFVPCGMTGEFKIPESAQKILPGAFRSCKISAVVIPDNIISVPAEAFSNCGSLKSIIFEGNRTNPIELTVSEDKTKGPFNSCSKVEAIVFPKEVDLDFADMKVVLSGLTGLKSIEFEAGNPLYSTVGGILTDAAEKTILYCPRGFQGTANIPNGIETISENAFRDCESVTEISIPVWVTKIETAAFYSMGGVTKVTFKGGRDEALTVHASAFAGCTNIESVTFEGYDYEEAGQYDAAITFANDKNGKSAAFLSSNSKTKLKTVTVGKGAYLTAFSAHMFAGQVNLTTVSVDDDAYVGAIRGYAFSDCTSLTAITVPSSVTTVDAYAFSNCVGMTSLTFAPGGTEDLDLKDNAFSGCSKLRTIHLPDRLDTFSSSVFLGCSGLTQIFVDKENKNFASDESGILFRKKTNDAGETIFTELLFYPTARAAEKNGVVDDLPDTLEVIGGSAFAGVTTVKSVTIPAGVKSIDNSAFANCENLEMLIFLGNDNPEKAPKTFTIGQKAFTSCGALSPDIVWPTYLTKIDKQAFHKAGIVGFVAPASLTSLGIGAFAECPNLITVDLSATKMTSLPGTANTAATAGPFWHCPALESIKLPATLTTIPKFAFANCYALETITFGTYTVTEVNGEKVYDVNSNLRAIGNNTFENCYSLQSLILPNSLVAIGNNCFANTADNPGQMTELIFELGGTSPLYIGTAALKNQAALTKVTFPARTYFPSAITNTATDANGNKTPKAPLVSDFLNQAKNNNIAKMFEGCNSLAEINIADEDCFTAVYASKEGVLYNTEMTMLFVCPAANVGAYKDGQPTYVLTVPEQVQVVMSMAFINCNKLTTLTFAEHAEGSQYANFLTMGNHSSATGVSSYAMFGTATSITTVNMPKHLVKVNGCGFAVDFTAEDGHPAMTINFNPNTPALELANSALTATACQTITIPSVKSLGTKMFQKSWNLTTVVIGKYATSIVKLPDYFLDECPKLTTYEIPTYKEMKTLGNYIFRKCTSLTQMTIPSNITKVGSYLFSESGIVTMTIPSSVTLGTTNDGTYMFQKCTSLTEVTFGHTTHTIGLSMFNGCTALTTIDISKVTATGTSAFNGCTSLDIDFTKAKELATLGVNSFHNTAITVADLTNTSITQMNNAFQNIPTLTEFHFPKNWSSYASGTNGVVFAGVPNLNAVYITGKFSTTLLLNNNEFFLGYVLTNHPNATIVFPQTIQGGYEQDEYGVYYDSIENPQILYWVDPNVELESYEVLNGTLVINDYAFAYSKIKSIALPNSVTAINKGAFYHAYASSITIPNDTIETPSMLKNIYAHAFYGSHITSFTVPDAVTFEAPLNKYNNKDHAAIENPFGGCPNLKTLILGASVVETPYNGLAYGSAALETLEFQEGITTIYGIYGNPYNPQATGHKLTTVDVPDTVTLLHSTFYGMDGLETVNFGERSALESIRHSAFTGCASLQSFVAPKSVTTMEAGTFDGCTSLARVDLSATGLTQIEEYTFRDTVSLTSIKLPAVLESIFDMAFYNSGFVDLTIPASVTELGVSTFENCKNLQTVTFETGSKITLLDATDGLWSGNLHGYNAPTGNANIFRGCEKLHTITLPNDVTVIGAGVFENTALNEIVWMYPDKPSKLQTIGEYAFANTAFEEVTFIAGVAEIGEGAFMNCAKLERVLFGNEITYFGGMAFAFCPELVSGYIPATVTTLGGNPFAGMSASQINLADSTAFIIEQNEDGAYLLTDFYRETVYGVYDATGTYTFETGVKAPGYAMGALAGTDITEIHIPYIKGKIDTISEYMFMNCKNLTTVTMDTGFTSLGDYAFYASGLTAVTLPTSVSSAGNYVFAECDSLTSVELTGKLMRFGNYAFAYCDNLANFSFGDTGTSAVNMGTHFFYNCPMITEVILPKFFSITSADAGANGITVSSLQNMIPSYMFAGTGIVYARIPSAVRYFGTAGVFANCKQLTKVSIYVASPDDGKFNSTYFEGCDALNGNIVWGDKGAFA